MDRSSKFLISRVAMGVLELVVGSLVRLSFHIQTIVVVFRANGKINASSDLEMCKYIKENGPITICPFFTVQIYT